MFTMLFSMCCVFVARIVSSTASSYKCSASKARSEAQNTKIQKMNKYKQEARIAILFISIINSTKKIENFK